MAVLLILGAVAIPTLGGLKSNSDQKAAADAVRGRIADARGLAMETGQTYRLAISADGTRLRLAPDVPEFATLPAADTPGAAATCLETKLDHATAGLAADEESGAAAGDGEWVTVATFLPEGYCRETGSVVEVHEANFPPIRILVRGVSGSSRVLPATDVKTGGGG